MLPAELLEEAPSLADTGSGSAPPAARSRGGDGGRGPLPFDPTRFGLLAFLASVSMLFVGFTSSLLLRRLSSDWQPLQAPSLLYVNTLVLAASSLCLEAARRRLRAFALPALRSLINATASLGLLFVAGQLL